MDPLTLTNQALEYLKLNFTIKDFQLKVVSNYFDGKDCFCVAGTGAGKSLTYTLCPIIMDLKESLAPALTESSRDRILYHIVIIIQPLVSLMRVQRDKLVKMGLQALYLGDDESKAEVVKGIFKKKYNYIILSPETATSDWFLEALHHIRKEVACLFVDESHCVKTL